MLRRRMIDEAVSEYALTGNVTAIRLVRSRAPTPLKPLTGEPAGEATAAADSLRLEVRTGSAAGTGRTEAAGDRERKALKL